MAIAMVWLQRVRSIVLRPDEAPHVYAWYGFPQDSGVHASLGLTEEAAGFTSYWASGQVVETDCRKPPAEIPKGPKAFPPWLLLQFADEGIEPAYRLHLAAVAAAEPLAGRPVPTPDPATAMPRAAPAFLPPGIDDPAPLAGVDGVRLRHPGAGLSRKRSPA
jgi:hypothetical protein